MRNKGFTMVELLAATLLSTLLFVTALSVIRTLGRGDTFDRSAQNWTLAGREQLEWDFKNAVVFRQDEQGLMLGGYGSLDARTLIPTNEPVLVIYSLRKINSINWLVRQQTSLDPLINADDGSELICGDVKSMSITGSYAPRTAPAEMNTNSAQDPTPIIFQRIAGSQRVPDRVRVRIDMQNESEPLMNTVLYLK